MNEKSEIVICLGSSCFSRGNKDFLKIINNFLETNNLKDKVHFHGNHCLGKCAEGPNIIINGRLYSGITSSSIVDILKRSFKI